MSLAISSIAISSAETAEAFSPEKGAVTVGPDEVAENRTAAHGTTNSCSDTNGNHAA